MVQIDRNVYSFFQKLISVDLVGGFHKIILSLHVESWKSEMNNEINRSTKFFFPVFGVKQNARMSNYFHITLFSSS